MDSERGGPFATLALGVKSTWLNLGSVDKLMRGGPVRGFGFGLLVSFSA